MNDQDNSLEENDRIAEGLKEILTSMEVNGDELAEFWFGWIESGQNEARNKGVAY